MTIEVTTPHGLARAHLQPVTDPKAALVLGHGAAGGVAAPDLVAATEVARAEGLSVALVEQPYRVAGRRSSPPAAQLDAAWIAVVEELRADALSGLSLVVGGRSAGARVACRTAEETGAVGVLCLAFPLQPPRRKSGAESPSRLSELDAVEVPTLVVQGERDRFRDAARVRAPHRRAGAGRPQPEVRPRRDRGRGAVVASRAPRLTQAAGSAPLRTQLRHSCA